MRVEAMKRRSRAGQGPARARRRKALKRKGGGAPKAVSLGRSSLGETEVARLTRELNQAREEQTATSEVLQIISSSPDSLEAVFAAMLEKAVRICDANFGAIYNWDGAALRLAATHNSQPAFAAELRKYGPRRPDAEGPIGHMVTTKKAIQVPDLAAEQAYTEQRHPLTVAAVELAGTRTLLFVPMLKEGELVGSFHVARGEVRLFTDKEIKLVENLAAQAVIAIENARLLNELRQRTADLTENCAKRCNSRPPLPMYSR
jgi:GAF domain-containing protein